MTAVSRGIRRNRRIVRALVEIRSTEDDFTSGDIAKRMNFIPNEIGSILKFVKGVKSLGDGRWHFTGDPIEVES